MPDPETIIIKGGALALLALSVIRLVLRDLMELRKDFQRKGRRH